MCACISTHQNSKIEIVILIQLQIFISIVVVVVRSLFVMTSIEMNN